MNRPICCYRTTLTNPECTCILSKGNVSQEASSMEELLTIEEVARILKVSVQTVRRMIDESELKAIKIRGQWRIKREDLQDYIDRRS
jgi:excisionase family DNA binding protein